MNDTGLTAKDIYHVALDTRNLEINLFWQRSNYFLVLNTALAVGFFNVQKRYPILLAALGLLVSILWFLANLASKFWQSRWEQRLRIVEETIAPGLDFFAADDKTIQDDVRKSLENRGHKGLKKLLYGQVSKKPSVSYLMILLSLFFAAAWCVLIVMAWTG